MNYKLLRKTLILLLAIVMIAPHTVIQAKSAIKTKVLKVNKVYYYDLDMDGKKEKIKYTAKPGANDNVTVALYINGSKKYTKKFKEEGYLASYTIADLNTKDKYLDLFLQVTGSSDYLTYAAFQRYEKKKIITTNTNKNNDFLDQKTEYSIKNVDGKGNFTITLDTPFSLPALGSYYTKISLKMKGKKVVKNKTDEYSYSDGGYKYPNNRKKFPLILRSNTPLYKVASRSSKVIKTMKKGVGVRVLKIKISNSKNYFKKAAWKRKEISGYAYVIDKSGKKGWIYLDKERGPWNDNPLFVEVLGWG